MTRVIALIALTLGLLMSAPTVACATELVNGGKLLLTGGVSNIEGAGGGGLASWAVITGYETRDGIGANVNYTDVELPDYTLHAYGAAVGLFDRAEVSYARQAFETGSTGGKLGIGDGYTFDQDIVGAKVRVLGDAVYDQDSWVPQVSVGVQYKPNDRGSLVRAPGARHASGVDYYVAATKLFLDKSLLINATVRMTQANQTGLLGFGGTSGYKPQFEGSAAYMLSRQWVVGAEYRTKPDNLRFAREQNAFDVFTAYAINKHLSVTLAYADLGSIATFKNQHGLYVSLQVGF